MAAFLRTYADFMGRPVMGEKTPAHLGYVDMLLEWFPGGKVVHIVRDPRAVYVSDCRRRRQRPTAPYSWLMRLPLLFPATIVVQTTLAWNSAARRHRDLERRHPTSYRMIRFEDLVRAPEETLPGLFDFLGVALPAGVTDVSVVSRGFMLGEAGLDAGAADRWREHTSTRWPEIVPSCSGARCGGSATPTSGPYQAVAVAASAMPSASSQRSASIAARQPSPAAVIACR